MERKKYSKKQQFESIEIEEEFLDSKSIKNQNESLKRLSKSALIPSCGAILVVLILPLIAYFKPSLNDETIVYSSKIDKAGRYLANTGVLLLMLGNLLLNIKLANKKNLVDKEVRRLWRFFFWNLGVSGLVTSVGLIMFSSFFDFLTVNYLVFTCSLLIVLMSFLYLFVLYNPILLINRPLMLIADFLRSTVILPIIWIPFVYFFPDLEYSFFSIAFYVALTVLFQILISEFRQSRLLPFQKTVINYVDSSLLSKQIIEKFDHHKSYSYLASRLKNVDDKDSVSEIAMKNEQIIKQLQQIYVKIDKRDKSIKYVLLAFLSFILGSIGEGLVQDLFNDDIKNLICKYINIYC